MRRAPDERGSDGRVGFHVPIVVPSARPPDRTGVPGQDLRRRPFVPVERSLTRCYGAPDAHHPRPGPRLVRSRPRRCGSCCMLLYPDPAYVDSYYYVNVARSLAAGHGFSIDFIWTFVDVGGHLPADPVLPIPSNAHWMPLASLVQVPFIVVLGRDGLRLGPAVRPDRRARRADGLGASPAKPAAARSVALGGAILAAVPAAVDAVHGPARQLRPVPGPGPRPRCGSARAPCAAMPGRSPRPASSSASRPSPATTASSSGRPSALVWLWSRVRARRAARAGIEAPRALPVWAAVVAARPVRRRRWRPGRLRQLAVFGSLSPSSSTGRILFIRSIDELNSITGTPTLAYLLGQGIGPLIASRITGFFEAIVIFSGPGRRDHPGPVHRCRRLAAPPFARLPAVLPVRRAALRLLGPGLRRPRPERDVHPFGRRPRAAGLPAGARGGRRPGRLGRPASAELERRVRRPGVRRRDDRDQPPRGGVLHGQRPCHVGPGTGPRPGGRRGPRAPRARRPTTWS